MTTISAILPTYNRAHTLNRALTSVFGQTRPPDEVIIVDDGSSDATAEVVSRFPTAKLVRLETNRGAAHARNVGIKMAKGDYIAFLDSDDVWLCNKLEAQLQRINSAPDISLLCTGITVQGCNGAIEYHGFDSPAPAHGWSFNEFQTYPFSPTTWLIRRSVLLDIGLFDESMPNAEDLDLLARMCGRHTMECLCEPLVVKYNQSDSLDANLSKTADSCARLFTRHQALWRQAPKAAANTHQRLANMYIGVGQMSNARVAFFRAARTQPWHIKPWWLLFLSLFGRRVYLRASRFLQRWA